MGKVYFSYCGRKGENEADRVIEQKGMMIVVMVTISASLPSIIVFMLPSFNSVSLNHFSQLRFNMKKQLQEIMILLLLLPFSSILTKNFFLIFISILLFYYFSSICRYCFSIFCNSKSFLFPYTCKLNLRVLVVTT